MEREMGKIIKCGLELDGMTPQQAIRHLTDIINRSKEYEKRFLRIETYMENYGHPFREGSRQYRIVVISND
jgi:hypothetical protein